MNRREFLMITRNTVIGLSIGFSGILFPAKARASTEKSALDGLIIIDPHAHPDMDPSQWQDNSSSYRFMKEIGMSASCYAAIGDHGWRTKSGRTNYEIAVSQLNHWTGTVIKRGLVKPVLKTADLPEPGSLVPGAIFSLEGGDALEGRVDRVNEFFHRGVRIITIVHYRNNELGDIMYARAGWDAGSYRGGLSPSGKAVIDRMQELGMVVDVAHASTATLKDIVSHCKMPVIDSHTTLCAQENACGRARTFTEMEWVAKTGGVVCSCPAAWHGRQGKSFQDWAAELLEMKNAIGIDHIGLGTDGGGSLPLISGYSDVRDLNKLAEAMIAAGFSKSELAAFMGGNIHRVLSKCLTA